MKNGRICIPAFLAGFAFILVGLLANTEALSTLVFFDKLMNIPFFRLLTYGFQVTCCIMGAYICSKKSWRETRNLLGNIGVSCLSVLVTIAILELCVRAAAAGTYESKHPRLFQFNSELGWEFTPGVKTRGAIVVSPDYDGVVKINASGMRDKERSKHKPQNVKRIAVLGDSFVANIDVAQDKVFTQIMENRYLLAPWEVLNFGVNGYSPVQELLLLQKKAVDFKPDIVIVVVYAGNDFDEILGTYEWMERYFRPKPVTTSENKMVFTRAQLNTKVRFKDRMPSFYLYRYLCDWIAQKNMRAIFAKPPYLKLCLKTFDYGTDPRCLAMKQAITRMQEVSRNQGARFLLVVMPTVDQVADDAEWEKLAGQWHIATEPYDRLLPNKFLGQVARDLNIDFLDLTAAFKNIPFARSALYNGKDWHLNDYGNDVVAKAVSEYLQNNNLLAR